MRRRKDHRFAGVLSIMVNETLPGNVSIQLHSVAIQENRFKAVQPATDHQQ
jgi:hypothetical protein